MLQRLVRVYTCQNVTLLEISCTGSFHGWKDVSQMVQGPESKEGEEGFIATGPSFCLNNIRVVNWGIVMQESNHPCSAYHAPRF